MGGWAELRDHLRDEEGLGRLVGQGEPLVGGLS